MTFGNILNAKKWVLAFLLVGILTLSSPAQTVPQNGLSLWLKSDTGVTTDANGNVTSWTDQSPSQIQLTVPFNNQGPTVQPTSSGISFENNAVISNQSAEVPNTSGDVTIITVASKDNLQTDGALVIVGQGEFSSRGMVYSGGGLLTFVDNGGTYSNDFVQGGPVFPKATVNTINAITFSQSTGATQMYSQGAPNPSSPLTLANATAIGQGVSIGSALTFGYFDPWSGTVSEVLVYNRVLSPAELASVTQYLSDKYGLYTPEATWFNNPQYSSFLSRIQANQMTQSQANAFIAESQAYPSLPTANLLDWFAADSTSSVAAPGGLVNSWSDLMTGNPVVPTGSSSPTYLAQDITGLPALAFNTNNFNNQGLTNNFALGSNYNGDLTIITLANTSNEANTETSFSLGQYNTGQLRSMLYSNNYEFFIGYGDDIYGGPGPTLNNYAIESVVIDTSLNPPDLSFYQNGTSTSTVQEYGPLNPPVSGIGVGSLPNGVLPWSGNIAEVLVYQGQLTPAQLAAVNTYFVDKYGLYNPTADWFAPGTTYNAIASLIQSNQWTRAEAAQYLALQNDPAGVTQNLISWFKADSIVGANDGDSIASWTDSATGNTLSQPDNDSQPTYVASDTTGKPALNFSGSQWLTNPGVLASSPSAEMTMVVVSSTTSPQVPEYAATLGVINQQGQDRGLGYLGGTEDFIGSSADATGAPAPSANTYSVEEYTLQFDQTTGTVTFFSDGVPVPNPTAILNLGAVNPSETIGAGSDGSSGWQGNIAEVMVYNQALTSSQQAAVNQYLGDKYGIYTPNSTWFGPGTQFSSIANLIQANQWTEAQALAYLNLPAPVISPNTALLAAGTPISITEAAPNATIYYTLDGTDPTTSSPVYSQPFTVTTPVTVKAIAYVGGNPTLESIQNYFDPSYAPVIGIIQENNLNAIQAAALLTEQQSNPNVVTNGLLNWFSSDSLPTTSAAVTSWTDLASGNNVAQPNPANQPAYIIGTTDTPASLNFNGAQNLSSNVALNSHYSGDLTIITVASSSTTSSPEYTLGLGQNSSGQARATGYSGSDEYFSGSSDDATGGPAPVSGNVTLEAVTLNQSSGLVSFYQNGNPTVNNAQLPTALTSPTTGVSIGSLFGGTSGWNGNIAEVLVYDHVLSQTEIQEINLYLGNKYGLYTPDATWYQAAKYASILPQIQANDWTQSQADSDLTSGTPVSGLVLNLNPSGIQGNQWTDSLGGHVFTASTSASPTLVTDTATFANQSVQFSGNGTFSCPDLINPNQDITVIAVESSDPSQSGQICSVGSYALTTGPQTLETPDFGDGSSDFVGTPASVKFSNNSVSLFAIPSLSPVGFNTIAVTASGSPNQKVSLFQGNAKSSTLSNETLYFSNDSSFPSSAPKSGMVLGGNGFDGKIVCLLVFNRSLSANEIQQVEQGLSDEYGTFSTGASWYAKPPYSNADNQSEIQLNQWNKAQADGYVALQSNVSGVETHGLINWFSTDSLNLGSLSQWTDQVTGNVVKPIQTAPSVVESSSLGKLAVHMGQGTALFNTSYFPALNSGMTIVTVSSTSNPSANDYLVDAGEYYSPDSGTTSGLTDTGRGFGYLNNLETLRLSGNSFSGGPAPSANTLTIETATLSNLGAQQSQISYFQNGVQTVAPQTISSPGPVTMGLTIGGVPNTSSNGNAWQGDISEVFIYDHPLTPNEMNNLDAYLSTKYEFYTPSAPWLSQYSPQIQSIIAANHWNVQQSATFASSLQNGVDTYGLALWLKADPASVTTDAAGHVSQWLDLNAVNEEALTGATTPTTHIASQSNLAQEPTLETDPETGLSSVRFNGAQSLVNSTDAIPVQNAVTIIAVAADDYPSKSGFYLQVGDVSQGGSARAIGVQSGELDFDDFGQGYDGGIAPNPGQEAIQTITSSNPATSSFGRSTVNYYLNGTLTGTNQSDLGTLQNGFVIGNASNGAQPITGNISELLVYNRVLTPVELDLAELYLANKYNLYHQNVSGQPDATWITSGNFSSEVLSLIQTNRWNLNQTNKYLAVQQSAAVPNGLISWYKADAGLSADSFGNIIWQDQGAYQNSLYPQGAAPVVTQSVLNGFPGLSFNGVNQSLGLDHYTGLPTGSQDRTVFLLTQYQGPGPGGLAYGSAANGDFSIGVGSDSAMSVDNGSSPQTFGPVLVNNGYLVQEAVLSNGTLTAYENGSVAGSPSNLNTFTTDPSGGIVLGSNISQTTYVKQTVCEALIYNRALSDAERQSVESYLTTKYNLHSTIQSAVGQIVANPPAGTYLGSQTVSLSSNTSGAAITYTLDGRTPTPTSTIYTGPISLPLNGLQTTHFTIKAQGYLSGLNPTPLFTATYTLNPDPNGPPLLSNFQFNGTTLNASSPYTITAPGTVNLTAQSISTLSSVSLALDGLPVENLSGLNSTYSGLFDPAPYADGSHTLSITGINALGKSVTIIQPIVIQLAAPTQPTLANQNTDVPVYNYAVIGTASPNTSVVITDSTGSTVTVTASNTGAFSGNVTLTLGSNTITATDQNRAGTSAASNPIYVTFDNTLPQAPSLVNVTSGAGGTIYLSWSASNTQSIQGYQIYRSTSPITSLSQATLISTVGPTVLTLVNTPTSDGNYYYAVATLSGSGVDSDPVGDTSPVVSNRVLPTATISYTPGSAPYNATTNTYGVGTVNVAVVTNESLPQAPVLTLVPATGMALPVVLTQAADSQHFSGQLIITPTTPSGLTMASFLGTDGEGNVGNSVIAGSSIEINTTGPSVTKLVTSPQDPIQNSSSQPVTINIVATLSEPVVGTPTFTYNLSTSSPTPQPIPSVVAGSDNLTWNLTLPLAATAGAANETLTISFSAADSFGNSGTTIVPSHQYQVYQSTLPGLNPPAQLTAVAEPKGVILLNWTAVNSASSYTLYRGTSLSNLTPLTVPTPITGLTYSDTPPADGQWYYTIATNRTANQETSVGAQLSPAVSAVSISTTPPAPTTLTAQVVASGVLLNWTDPASVTEPLTLNLYRSTAPITSISGLVSYQSGIKLGLQSAVDPSPLPAQPYYALAAVDNAGNISSVISTYVDVSLLPVTTLSVNVSSANAPPLVSWSDPTQNLSGYILALDNAPLNTPPFPASTTSFSDSAYSSGTLRTYTVTALDANGHSSPARSVTLIPLTATLSPSALIERGLPTDLIYTVSNLSSQNVATAQLFVTVNGTTQPSAVFQVAPGQSVSEKVVVAGAANLITPATVSTTLVQTPQPGEQISSTSITAVPVTQGAVPLVATASNCTLGGNGQAQFALTNTSAETIEVLCATQNGAQPSTQAKFNLIDGLGNTLTQTPLQFVSGNNVLTLPNGDSVIQIFPGETYTSPIVSLPIPQNAGQMVTVQIELDQLYYDHTQPDEISLSGAVASTTTSTLQAAYYGMVTSVSPAVSNGVAPITISGFSYAGGSSVTSPVYYPNAPLVLNISSQGFDFTSSLTTDATGHFTTTFTPTAGMLGGNYAVYALNPVLNDNAPQASFTLDGLSVSPTSIVLQAPFNYTQSIPISVTNAAGGALTNVALRYLLADQPGAEVPGITFTPPPPIATLAPSASGTLTATLTGNNSAPTSGTLFLRVSSRENPLWQLIQVNYSFAPANPVLAANPAAPVLATNPNTPVSQTITLTNSGAVALASATFTLQNADGTVPVSWASLQSASSAATVGANGGTFPISVNFVPPATGDFDFQVVVNAQNHAAFSIPIHLTCTTNTFGQIQFQVVDALSAGSVATGFSTGVLNATILLQNQAVLTSTFSQTTDQYGLTTFQNLPAGSYSYQITAANHNPVSGSVIVQPGSATPTQQIVLPYQPVQITWSVVPTTITDIYNLVFNTTFETNVPVPELVFNPGSVPLPASLQPGQVFQGQATLTNEGLVAANNLKITMPADDGNYHYALASPFPTTIAAQSSITVQYILSRITPSVVVSTNASLSGTASPSASSPSASPSPSDSPTPSPSPSPSPSPTPSPTPTPTPTPSQPPVPQAAAATVTGDATCANGTTFSSSAILYFTYPFNDPFIGIGGPLYFYVDIGGGGGGLVGYASFAAIPISTGGGQMCMAVAAPLPNPTPSPSPSPPPSLIVQIQALTPTQQKNPGAIIFCDSISNTTQNELWTALSVSRSDGQGQISVTTSSNNVRLWNNDDVYSNGETEVFDPEAEDHMHQVKQYPVLLNGSDTIYIQGIGPSTIAMDIKILISSPGCTSVEVDATVLDLQLVAPQIDSDGQPKHNSDGSLDYSRRISLFSPPCVDVIRVNEYYKWFTRTSDPIHTAFARGRASFQDPNYGIYGMLPLTKNQPFSPNKRSVADDFSDQATKEINPYVNIERSLFKLRMRSFPSLSISKIYITPHLMKRTAPNNDNLPESDTPIGFPVTTITEDGQAYFQTNQPILVYCDPHTYGKASQLLSDAKSFIENNFVIPPAQTTTAPTPTPQPTATASPGAPVDSGMSAIFPLEIRSFNNIDELLSDDTVSSKDNSDNDYITALPAIVQPIQVNLDGSTVAGPSIHPSELQISLDKGSSPLNKYNPSVPSFVDSQGHFQSLGSVTDTIVPLQEASQRYSFLIDANDTTPNAIFDLIQKDKSSVTESLTTEWYLRYKFRQGNPFLIGRESGNHNYVGTVWDVDAWHKLPNGDSTMSLRKNEIPDGSGDDSDTGFNGDNETTPALKLGELGPGDYELFCRVYDNSSLNSTDVFESNLIDFRIMSQNPADGGRSRRTASGEYGPTSFNDDRPPPINSSIPQIPTAIKNAIEALPAISDSAQYSSLISWFEAIVKHESRWGGVLTTRSAQLPDALKLGTYGWLQDWDCFSRAPENQNAYQSTYPNPGPEGNSYFDGGPPTADTLVYTDAGYREVHENYSFINRYLVRAGEVRTDYDNGFGVVQQTHGDPPSVHAALDPFRHVNRWKHNVLAGWEEFVFTDIPVGERLVLKDYKLVYPRSHITSLNDLAGLGVDSQTVSMQVIIDSISAYKGSGEIFENGKDNLYVSRRANISYVNDVINEWCQLNNVPQKETDSYLLVKGMLIPTFFNP